jgi:hypothetical protein
MQTTVHEPTAITFNSLPFARSVFVCLQRLSDLLALFHSYMKQIFNFDWRVRKEKRQICLLASLLLLSVRS